MSRLISFISRHQFFYRTIAVADPLWMFVPPEYLTAEELAVPVMTWINGVAHVGDLDDPDELSQYLDSMSRDSLAAPIDFDAGTQRLSSLLARSIAVNPDDILATPDSLSGSPVVESSSSAVALNTIEKVAEGQHDQSTADLFESIDLAKKHLAMLRVNGS